MSFNRPDKVSARLQTCLHIIRILFLLKFFLNTVIFPPYIYVPVFHNVHQTLHPLCFPSFSSSLISHSSVFFFPLLCTFHVDALLIFHSSAFLLQPIHLRPLPVFLRCTAGCPSPSHRCLTHVVIPSRRCDSVCCGVR